MIGSGTILAHVDVAQVAVYVFWGCFAALIYYLRREDHREGYPLVPDVAGTDVIMFPPVPSPKYFITPTGERIASPRSEEAATMTAASRVQSWAGAPYAPHADPLVDAVGPAAYPRRSEHPEEVHELDGGLKLVPLRAAPAYHLAAEDVDPRGMTVLGNDHVVVGEVTDVWIDRGEMMLRFFEVGMLAEFGGGAVLMPTLGGKLSRSRHELVCTELSAEQLASAPRVPADDRISPQEDDRIAAYFGGGRLYGKASRAEPVL